MSATTCSKNTASNSNARHHGVATEVPRAIKREAEALRLDGCTDVRISMLDRKAGVWAITFTSEDQRKAILMWTVEVEV